MRIVFLLLFSVLSALPVFGADSTSFDPTRVAVTAKGSGVPVGTIIAWPVATNPEDMDNWLECNGQSVNPSVYPELSAIIGHQVPDLRGLFLRGQGGNSAALGVKQSEGFHVPNGAMSITLTSVPVGQNRFLMGGDAGNAIDTIFLTPSSGSYTSITSQAVFHSTAPEIRPVNVAVRYLIRAQP